ncbi:UNVERIFIED_CONTAM: hypothetical protein FKN15_064432 [Acipenser sinensis]
MSHQLLCACELSLRITGECSALIELIERNIDALSEDFPSSQVTVGLSLLLLQAPANQQTPILDLALKIIAPSETQLLLSTAPILVMPLLQIISSAAVMEVLSDSQISTSNQQLALTLLHTVQGQDEGRKEDSVVASSGYKALSEFSAEEHIIPHLPEQACTNGHPCTLIPTVTANQWTRDVPSRDQGYHPGSVLVPTRCYSHRTGWQQEDMLSINASDEGGERELAFLSEEVESDSTSPAAKISMSAELLPLIKRATAVFHVPWPIQGEHPTLRMAPLNPLTAGLAWVYGQGIPCYVTGPEFIPPELVKVALEPVASVRGSFQFPPVNWAVILSLDEA